jgi:hypothetical protein
LRHSSRLSPFNSFEYAVALAAPADSAKVCSPSGVTTTERFKCRPRKYWASFTVIHEGEIPPF